MKSTNTAAQEAEPAPAPAPAAPGKRGPGRPRKTDDAAPAPAPAPAAAAPIDPDDIELIDRKGAAKLLGKSLTTIAWLEENDPDFPAAFTLGKNNFYFMKHEVLGFVPKKAEQARLQKQKKIEQARLQKQKHGGPKE